MLPRYIEAQKSVPLAKIQKYFISASRMAQAYLVDGATGDNVQEIYKALKKRQKVHRGAVDLDPEPKIRRPATKPFLQPQIPAVVVPSSQDPIVITLEDLDLEDVGSDTSDSEMERDSEESDSEIIVEE